MLYEVLVWLESSALGEALRGSGVWTYGLLNLGHILGIGSLFGAVLILDLRLLGLWPGLSLSSLSRATVPVAGIGLVLALVSGLAMLSVNGSEYHGNPFMFYMKFPALLVALVNIAVMERVPAWRQRHTREPLPGEKRVLALFGAISLLSWLLVIAGGRMIGYW